MYKGFHLSFVLNWHLDIDRDIATTHCRYIQGDSVDLLSRTICTTIVVGDWCITNLAYGWRVLIKRTVGIIRGENCSLGGLLW